MNQLTVSSSPHIRSARTTQLVMLDVIIALLPATVSAVVIFGWYSLALIAVCVGVSVLSEALFNIICKKEQTVGDLSAALTGLILALNLPTSLALWQAAIGTVFATVVAKCLFGGLGKNFVNPALFGRMVLFVSFADFMSASNPSALPVLPDAFTGATPLAAMPTSQELPSTLQLLFGLHGGMIGETCAVALIVGGIYLLIRRVITWHIPVTFIATVALGALIANQDPIVHILSGGLLLGAIFMATDYVTSPATPWGKVIFGVGCGIITVVIRIFGNYPEGVSFAIFLMNILCPYVEHWTVKRPLGTAKKPKKAKDGEAK